MKNLNVQELSIKEQENINGGSFFSALGAGLKRFFCNCYEVDKPYATGSVEDIMSNPIKW
ncbi:hypothetical protein ACYSNM_13660 [Myroides sp. LJL116]